MSRPLLRRQILAQWLPPLVALSAVGFDLVDRHQPDLQLPWQVVVALIVIAVCLIIFTIIRLLPSSDGNALSNLSSKKTAFTPEQPTFRVTALSDHDLNVENLARQAPLLVVGLKISVLEYFSQFIEREWSSHAYQLTRITINKNTKSLYNLTTIIRDQMGFISKNYESEQTKRCNSDDLIAATTVWGLDELLVALASVSESAKKLTEAHINDGGSLMNHQLEQLDTSVRGFVNGRNETQRNIRAYILALRRRLVEES